MGNLHITYRFSQGNEAAETFVVELCADDLSLSLPKYPTLPFWSELAHCQCPECPLQNSQETHCPMAAGLVELQRFAGQLSSFAPLSVTVTTLEREMRMMAPAQRAISSLMGLLIATCACPEVAWLRPMARFHLPLASEEESIYRSISTYLLAQYFRHKAGKEPDLELTGLGERYRRLHTINVGMAARLRSAVEGLDAPVNAVILLDVLTKTLPYSVNDSVAELEYLFKHYLDC